LSFGLDAFGAKTLSPQITDLKFVKANAHLSLARQLADRVILRLAAAGQLTNDRLPAVEQFALGGSEFGRGYEAAALIGDEGYAGSAELAYRAPGLPDAIRDAELYGFVDGGSTTYRARAGAPSLTQSLGSAGIGVRGMIREHVALQVDATKAIGDSQLPEAGAERLIFAIRTVW